MSNEDPKADWKAEWDPVIAQIGNELSSGQARPGIDRVEAGAVRKYLEPLEFDCALHTDAQVARSFGYDDIIAPYTAIATFAMPAIRPPGHAIFTNAERNAQPAKSSVKPIFPPGTPPVTGYFATDFEVEYLRPVTVGERLSRIGYKLLECEPKETKIGRGAFLKFESLVCGEDREVVARYMTGLFLYNPFPKAGS